MLILKCIGCALIGGVLGFIAFIVGWIALKIFVGLIFWNAQLGSDVAIFAVLAIPLGMFLGFIIPINSKSMAEAEAKKRDLEEEQARVEAEQERLRREATFLKEERLTLASVRECSKSTVASLNTFLESAEGWLNVAESEFKQRAYSPFWDAMEEAASFLGAYHTYLKKVAELVADHERRRKNLSIEIPSLSLSDSSIPDPRPAAARLTRLGREGQKNFRFATIYEQRKTNQLLYSGFGTLKTGLERMQYAITDALNDLSDTLGSRLDDLIEVSSSHAEAFSNFSKSATSHFEASAAHSEASVAHYEASEKELRKQTEMLDNIQRRKKPPEGTIDRILHIRVEGDTKTPHDVSADD